MGVRINPSEVFAPINGLPNVSIDLSELQVLFGLQEELGAPVNDWGSVNGQTHFTSITGISLTDSPNITEGSITWAHVGSITFTALVTIPITSPLEYDTEYSWSVSFNYTYDSYENGSGSGSHTSATVTFTTEADPNPDRTINLSSPTDTDTDILLQPLLQWSIDGGGAVEGDLLDIYLRKDDANFTGDDLLAGLVDATLNSSLQIVAGLEYNATYYWQVQAFASEEDDLLSSSVFSFTVQSFSPPAYSVHPVSGLPTGESNQITVRRLVAIANNKFWFEDI